MATFVLAGSIVDVCDGAEMEHMASLYNGVLRAGAAGDLRTKAAASEQKGLECILKTQFRHNGNLTVWGQQHDHQTLYPVGARKWELASLCAWERVGVVEYLMGYDNPEPRVKEAVQCAVKWFDEAKLKGLRIERRPLAKPWYGYWPAELLKTKYPVWQRRWEPGDNVLGR